tara:strand:- start:1935 stop:3224 length:1290 start_codon:yes stop_codon:yes gene_type:complete
MAIYEFTPTDILFNTIKTHPSNEFFTVSGNIFYQNQNAISGANVSNVYGIPTGFVSLYQINVDRDEASTGRTIGPEEIADTGLVYPFLVKGTDEVTFKTISQDEYASASFGHVFTASYNLSASVSRNLYSSTYISTMEANNSSSFISNFDAAAPDEENISTIKPLFTASVILALKNTLNYNSRLSPHFLFNASIPGGPNRDLSAVNVNLLSVPSIIYGSKMKPGTVKLETFHTGTLVCRYEDTKKNGELIRTFSKNSFCGIGNSEVVGVVLYNEGFMLLTSSVVESAGPGAAAATDFFTTTTSLSSISSSYYIAFSGTNPIPVNTYIANAPKGKLNWSNNRSYVSSSTVPVSGSGILSGTYFVYEQERTIQNIASSSINHFSASFENVTYINHINLFDDEGNLIGVAKTSKPVKKEEDRDFTFKLKLDM